MCDLMAAIGFGLSAASSVVGYEGQVQPANQQNEMYVENAKAANENLKSEYYQNQQRMIQEQEAAATQKREAQRELRGAQATATVAAGEAGVSGLSVDALLNEYAGRTGEYNDKVDQQTEWTMAQLNNNMRGFQSKAQDRINSVQRANKPSFLDTGLRIASAGLGSVNDYNDRIYKQKMAAAGG